MFRFNKEESGYRNVNKKTTATHLARKTLRDRKFDPSRMLKLMDDLQSGRWHVPKWALAKCLEDGEVYRVNGKHSAKLLDRMIDEGIPLPEIACRILFEVYQCDTLQDVADLYATFDSRISARTPGDNLVHRSGMYPELNHISQGFMQKVTGGILIHETGCTSYTKASDHQRGGALDDNRNFILAMYPAFNDRLLTSPVVGAMYAIWLTSDRAAWHEFFSEVTDQQGAHGIARKLREYLLNPGNKTRGRLHDARKLYSYTISAWNSWRRGRQNISPYQPDEALPEPVR